MSKHNIGDILEFIPGNYIFKELGGSHWLEGACIVIDIENNNYVLNVFNLVKISIRNFTEYHIGESILRLPIDDCDSQNCFRSLEE